MRVKFKYKNHRGNIEDRDVDIQSLDYFTVPNEEHGYSPGWFISGFDYSRDRDGSEFRSFALANIQLPPDFFINPSTNRVIRFELEK